MIDHFRTQNPLESIDYVRVREQFITILWTIWARGTCAGDTRPGLKAQPRPQLCKSSHQLVQAGSRTARARACDIALGCLVAGSSSRTRAAILQALAVGRSCGLPMQYPVRSAANPPSIKTNCDFSIYYQHISG
jgi:hypothetical protein